MVYFATFCHQSTPYCLITFHIWSYRIFSKVYVISKLKQQQNSIIFTKLVMQYDAAFWAINHKNVQKYMKAHNFEIDHTWPFCNIYFQMGEIPRGCGRRRSAMEQTLCSSFAVISFDRLETVFTRWNDCAQCRGKGYWRYRW